MPDLLATLRRLADVLDRAQIRYALAGGLALAVRARLHPARYQIGVPILSSPW
jgi:hypothetical protein